MKEPTLSQFPSARFKIFVDYQMLTISQFSGWGKGNVAQNKDNFYREYGRETLLHEARAVEVISFLRANRRMSTFRSTLKELGFVFLNTNGKAQNNHRQNPVIGKETQKLSKVISLFFGLFNGGADKIFFLPYSQTQSSKIPFF